MTRRRPPGTPPGPCGKCGEVHFRCKAHARTGLACQRPKLEGQEVCHFHGGKNPHAMAAAAKRVAQAKATSEVNAAIANLGIPADMVDPTEALLQLITWKHAEVVWLRDKVIAVDADALVWGKTEEIIRDGGELGDETKFSAGVAVWYQLLHEAENQLAGMAATVIRAGLDKRRVEIAETVGHAVAGTLRAIAVDVSAALRSAGYDAAVLNLFSGSFDRAARTHLLAIEAGPTKEQATP